MVIPQLLARQACAGVVGDCKLIMKIRNVWADITSITFVIFLAIRRLQSLEKSKKISMIPVQSSRLGSGLGFTPIQFKELSSFCEQLTFRLMMCINHNRSYNMFCNILVI
jgi:hypothetical protein